MEEKIHKIAKLEIMKDLHKRKFKRYKGAGCRCLIFWKATTVNIPKGVTLTTENLRPGELIHMNFCFLGEKSIRKRICALVIADVNVKKMRTFNTPGKRPPV